MEIAAMSSTCRVQVFELNRQHEDDLVDLLLSLDVASRIARFNGALDDASLLQHSRRVLTSATWIAGIFIERRLRGLVEAYDTGDPGIAEVAFLVVQSWRRRGLGTALLQAAIRWAFENDRTTLRMVFSTTNWPMRKLAGNSRARVDIAFDEIVADIAITPALRLDLVLGGGG
jgi:GNAT superfamily N-acetyltransferase